MAIRAFWKDVTMPKTFEEREIEVGLAINEWIGESAMTQAAIHDLVWALAMNEDLEESFVKLVQDERKDYAENHYLSS